MKKLYRKGTVHPTSDNLSFLPAAIFTLTVALSQEDKQVLAYLISCSSGAGSGNFSGKQRTTHKSTIPNSAPATSTSGGKNSAAVSSAVYSGGEGPDSAISGNRRTTLKSTTPNSANDTYGGGAKGGAAVTSAVCGGSDHVPSFNCYCFSCYMSYWIKWDSSANRQLIHEILDAYEDGLLQSKKEKSKKERRNRNKGSVSSSSNELKKSTSESNLKKNGPGQPEPVEEFSGSRDGGGDVEDKEEIGGGGGEEGCEKGSVRKFVSFLGERIWSVWT